MAVTQKTQDGVKQGSNYNQSTMTQIIIVPQFIFILTETHSLNQTEHTTSLHSVIYHNKKEVKVCTNNQIRTNTTVK